MAKYHDRYLAFRQELWQAFELLVRHGASFPQLIDVTYSKGINPPELSVDSEGNSWFYAKVLEQNPGYTLHYGEDMIVGTSKVVFIDNHGCRHEIEPDSLDLYWLSSLLDEASIRT